MDFSRDSDAVSLRIEKTGEELDLWESYTYGSEFFTDSDAWSFKIYDPTLFETWVPKLRPGTIVTLEIDGKSQCKGRVDGWRISADRGSGTAMEVSGRDMLGPMVAGCVDPINMRIASGTTLLAVIAKVAVPYGFRIISTTDIVNRSVITGNNPKTTSKTSTTTTVEAPGLDGGTEVQVQTIATEFDPTRPKDLRAFTTQEVQPHWSEGAFAFLARLCKHYGLWLWCDTLGETLIVGEPDQNQEPLYAITRRFGAGATYLNATFEAVAKEQPAIIIAEGKVGKNPNYPNAKTRVAIVNELVALESDGKTIRSEVQAIINAHPGCRVLPIRPDIAQYARYFEQPDAIVPMFSKVDEARTIEQVEGFARKEMGIRQGKALKFTCSVDGHSQGGLVWAVNTTCRVDDEVTGAQGTFWIRSRTLTKDRSGGTKTTLEMVPQNLLQIGE